MARQRIVERLPEYDCQRPNHSGYRLGSAGTALTRLLERLEPSHLKGPPLYDDEAGSPSATRPYQVVEFDGHRLDIRLKVTVPVTPGRRHLH